MPKHLTVTQASLTSLFVYLVGQAVAFVPAISSQQQQLISVGSLVIAAVFALAHLVQDFAANKAKITLSDLEGGIRSLAKEEVGKVPFTQIAEDVVSGHGLSDVEGLVKSELNKILLATGLEHAQAQADAAVVAATPVASPVVPPAV